MGEDILLKHLSKKKLKILTDHNIQKFIIPNNVNFPSINQSSIIFFNKNVEKSYKHWFGKKGKNDIETNLRYIIYEHQSLTIGLKLTTWSNANKIWKHQNIEATWKILGLVHSNPTKENTDQNSNPIVFEGCRCNKQFLKYRKRSVLSQIKDVIDASFQT